MKYKYIRVSTEDQNTDRQSLDLAGFEVIIEKKSGKYINSNLAIILDKLEAGDELHVHSLDRLGRSAINNLKILELILDKQTSLIVDNQYYIKNGKMSAEQKVQFTIFSAFAELELDTIKRRIFEGMMTEQAKKNLLNRPASLKKQALLSDTRFKWWLCHRTKKQVGIEFNISISTVSSYKKELGYNKN